MKKKLIGFLCAMALVFGMVGFANSAPVTWVDVYDPADVLIPPAYSYFHNIADDGFESWFMNPGVGDDVVTSYDLEVALYDDGPATTTIWGMTVTIPELFPEAAAIWTSGGVYSYDFSLSSETYSGGVLGVLDICHDGTLNVLIDRAPFTLGDFYFASSTLTAYGDDGTAPVPEPTTMLLFGTGLLGLAGARRKFKK